MVRPPQLNKVDPDELEARLINAQEQVMMRLRDNERGVCRVSQQSIGLMNDYEALLLVNRIMTLLESPTEYFTYHVVMGQIIIDRRENSIRLRA